MKTEYIPFVEELIELAIKEDIGDGDHTSLSTIPADARGRMKLLVKQEGIIAGIEVAVEVFRRLDESISIDLLVADGDHVKVGDVAFYVEGRIQTLLQAERIVLNIMQRMSGVATQTAVYAKALGVDIDELYVAQPDNGEQALDICEALVRSGAIDIVVIDSVAALVPKQEIEGDMAQTTLRIVRKKQ